MVVMLPELVLTLLLTPLRALAVAKRAVPSLLKTCDSRSVTSVWSVVMLPPWELTVLDNPDSADAVARRLEPSELKTSDSSEVTSV